MKILSIEKGYNRNIINYEEDDTVKQYFFSNEKSLESALKDLNALSENQSANRPVRKIAKKENTKKHAAEKMEKTEQ